MAVSQKPDVVASIVAHVHRALAEGRLAPGQRLVESELTATLGSSRGPVREALGRLAAEGTVTIERHKGASIRKLTRADVVALYDVREMLEGLAARLAAERAPKSARRAIATALAGASAAARARDVTRYAAANSAFHVAILDAAAHPILPGLVARLRLPVLRVQFRVLLQTDTIAASQRDHARIAAAIDASDGAKAEAAMRRHIARSAAVVADLPDGVFG